MSTSCEFATHSFNMYAIYSFQSGRPLKIFLDEMQKYARLLDELHQEHLIPHRSVFVEAAAVLLGETKDALSLKGQAFDEEEYSNFLHTVQDCAFYYHSAKLMLAFYAEEWDIACHHADEALRLREAVLGSWGVSTVLSGIVQGLGAEIIFALFFYRRFGIAVAALAGVGAAVAAWVFELFYGSSPNILKSIEFNSIYLVCVVVSGAILAGVVGWLLVRALAVTGALNRFAVGREHVREV